MLSLHYNGPDSYLYINGEQLYKFTAKTQLPYTKEINLSILSDEFTDSEAKQVALKGKVYEFSVDFRKRTTDKIENIHHYLMEKHYVP